METSARLTMVLALALAGCGGARPADNEANSAAAPTQVASAPAPAAPALAGCADALTASLDKESFEGTGINASAGDKAGWVTQGAEAFKSAAAALCAAKKLDPATLAAKRRLLVQYGAGADSAAVYEPEENAGETITLQYAFWPGSPGPSKEDVGEAIQCWDNPELDMCAGREP